MKFTLVTTTITMALVSGCQYKPGEPEIKDGRVMTQKEFPCEEDEVLGYHPKFGPRHVGCIRVRSSNG